MKIVEVERSGTVAWSPSSQFPAVLASGTAAGSLDIDFDTSAHIELFQMDFAKGAMNVVGKTSAVDRLTKLAWGQTGIQTGVYPKGLLVGGLANGTVSIWDASKIFGNMGENEATDALIANCEKHVGAVPGLDFNPYQHNLLASGGSDSEIFVWDLQNPKSPVVFNPGAKQQVYQDSGVTCVQWNRKVQHILGSTNYSGVAVVWDLKAKRAVLSFNSPSRKLRCKSMAWHPEEATQLVTASEDDSSPIIELWDLRNTYSPIKVLEGHTRGIWSLSWSPMDSDLLLSCGKDSRTLCWNVRTGEVLSDVEVGSQSWNADVQWAPKIPAILSTCSLDKKITIHSVQDTRSATSFGGAQVKQSASAPKWLKRPVGVSFGFGGKIISFKKNKQNEPRSVKVSQVVSDPEFLARSDKLEQALASNDLAAFCAEKAQSANSQEDQSTWALMKLLLEKAPRSNILQYFGFSPENIKEELHKFISQLPELAPKEAEVKETKEEKEEEPEQKTESQPKEEVDSLFTGNPTDSADNLFASIGQQEQPQPTEKSAPVAPKKPLEPIHFATEGLDGVITRALVIGNFEAAVECCIRSDLMAEALIIAGFAGPELLKKTQETYFNLKAKPSMKMMSYVIKGELRELVERADLAQWTSLLAVICTYAKSEQFALLCSLLGDRLAVERKDNKSAIQCYICGGNVDKLLQLWGEEAEREKEGHLTSLQTLVEKVSVFRKTVQHKEPLNEAIAKRFSEYAQLLASQGKLESACHCLSFLTEAKYDDTTSSPFILLDRLFYSQKKPGMSVPPSPFQRLEIGGRVAQPAAKTTAMPPMPVKTPAPGPSPVKPFVPVSPPVSTGPVRPQPGPVVPPVSMPPVGRPPVPGVIPGVVPNVAPGVIPGLNPNAPRVVPPTTPTHPVAPPPANTFVPPPTNTFVPPTTFVPPVKPVNTFVPPTGNIGVPPTPMTHMPPPTTTPSVVAPPPMTPPPTSAPAVTGPPPMTAPPVSSAPSPKKEVATSQENGFVVQSLKQILQQCSSSADPKVSKYSADVVKRLQPMTDKFEKNEFSAGITQSMSQLCQAILNGDSTSAHTIHVKITQEHWEELGSNIMIGLKRLVEITKN